MDGNLCAPFRELGLTTAEETSTTTMTTPLASKQNERPIERVDVMCAHTVHESKWKTVRSLKICKAASYVRTPSQFSPAWHQQSVVVCAQV